MFSKVLKVFQPIQAETHNRIQLYFARQAGTKTTNTKKNENIFLRKKRYEIDLQYGALFHSRCYLGFMLQLLFCYLK